MVVLTIQSNYTYEIHNVTKQNLLNRGTTVENIVASNILSFVISLKEIGVLVSWEGKVCLIKSLK